MSYSFRIRINRSSRNFFDSDQMEVRLPSRDARIALFLRSATHGKSIKEAEQLVLAGEGFTSEEAAWEAGQRFEEAFMIALSKNRIGADFGDRAAEIDFTEPALRVFLPPGFDVDSAGPLLNDVRGLTVYPLTFFPPTIASPYWPRTLSAKAYSGVAR
jgi:hypothetical protein